MKRYLIIFLVIVSASLVSCDLEQDYTPPNYVTFESEETDFTIVENTSGSLDVTVYTANVSGSDRTFDINVVESSTLDAAAYTIPATVTVPGGTNEGTFTIDVTDTNIDNAGETLVLDLADQQGLHTGEPLTVNILRFCPIDIADYVGSFTGTGSWSEIFGYTTEVETFLNEDGELMINGLVFQWFQDWWGEVIVRNEPVKMEIDLETGLITIPEQFYIESTWEGATQPLYSIKGTGRINACEGTMIIKPVLVQGGAAIDPVSFGGVPFLETIRLDTTAGEGDGATGEGDGSEEEGDTTGEGDTAE